MFSINNKDTFKNKIDSKEFKDKEIFNGKFCLIFPDNSYMEVGKIVYNYFDKEKHGYKEPTKLIHVKQPIPIQLIDSILNLEFKKRYEDETGDSFEESEFGDILDSFIDEVRTTGYLSYVDFKDSETLDYIKKRIKTL